MTLTRTRFRRIIGIAAAIAAIILIAAYAVWRSFAYASGPRISIFAPVDGASISSTTVEISGQVLRASQLTLNGYPTSVDEKGDFSQTLAVFPGANTITLTATDQFGRSIEKRVTILGTIQLPE
jgi:hypothetical protein